MQNTLPSRTLGSLALLIVTTASPGLAQIQDLGGAISTGGQAERVSRDGQVVLVTDYQNGLTRWTEDGGPELLIGLPGESTFLGSISDDGTVVAGSIGNQLGIWDAAGTLTVLDPTSVGYTGARATDMSGDGSVVVGSLRDPGLPDHAFVWTQATGFQDIHPSAAMGNTSYAIGVSRDGSTVMLQAVSAGVVLPFVWSASTGAVDASLPGRVAQNLQSISDDGQVVLGTGRIPGTSHIDAYRWTLATGPMILGPGTNTIGHLHVSGDGSTFFGGRYGDNWRWTEAEGFTPIPLQYGGYFTCSNHDGSVQYGFRSVDGPFGTANSRQVPFKWTPDNGVENLAEAGGPFSYILDCSSDGSVMVGRAGSASLAAPERPVRWRADGFIGSRYCAPGSPNSVSQDGGKLELSGTNIAAVGAMELRARDLPLGSFGFFLGSPLQGLTVNPGGSQGTLCLGGNIGRFVGPGQIMGSGTTGAFALTIDPSSMPTPTGFVSPAHGETWNFQAWYRDANPGVTSNLTNAASIPIY
jgi:uncharacterized membrane protein